METKLRYVGDNLPIMVFRKTPFYVTQFPRDSNGDMLFIIDSHTDVGWGDDRLCFTGMNSYVVTRQELKDNFELWED